MANTYKQYEIKRNPHGGLIVTERELEESSGGFIILLLLVTLLVGFFCLSEDSNMESTSLEYNASETVIYDTMEENAEFVDQMPAFLEEIFNEIDVKLSSI